MEKYCQEFKVGFRTTIAKNDPLRPQFIGASLSFLKEGGFLHKEHILELVHNPAEGPATFYKLKNGTGYARDFWPVDINEIRVFVILQKPTRNKPGVYNTYILYNRTLVG
jgi:hypothetical protein